MLLEIEEQTGVSFKSTHQGKMHACGHDGHMTALLGLAYKLKDVQDLPHNVLLIFQPGEEVVNGHHQLLIQVFLKNIMLKEFMVYICSQMLMKEKLLVVKVL